MLLWLEMWLGWRFWHEKEEGRLQNPLLTPRSASASSQLPVQCLRVMPCSGKLRLHAKLCFLLFIKKKKNKLCLLAAGKSLGM